MASQIRRNRYLVGSRHLDARLHPAAWKGYTEELSNDWVSGG